MRYLLLLICLIQGFAWIVRRRVEQGFTVIQSEPIGAPFHLQENILGGKFNTRLSDVKDPKKQIPEYFKNVMTAYATTIIDLFIECEKLGKLVCS